MSARGQTVSSLTSASKLAFKQAVNLHVLYRWLVQRTLNRQYANAAT